MSDESNLFSIFNMEECDKFSSILCTPLNTNKSLVPPNINTNNKGKGAPIRLGPRGTDLETVDEKTRKRLVKNRASAEKSRINRKTKMKNLEVFCKQQEQLILCLREQLERVTKSVNK